MKPFAPFPHSTSLNSVGATSTEVSLHAAVEQVWIDNRGATDVLVEFFDAPLDADSFRIPTNSAQPLSAPLAGSSWDNKIRLKRPAGSTSELVIVCSGAGF